MIPLLISIDPFCFRTKGNVGGWAIFQDGKLLLCSGFNTLGGLPMYRDVTDAVIETPVHYKDSNTPPQDLIDLAFDAGRMVSFVCPQGAHHMVTPAGWKGQTPKEVTIRRVAKLLATAEHGVLEEGLKDIRKSWHHNIYDAIGLGLWKLGRMPR